MGLQEDIKQLKEAIAKKEIEEHTKEFKLPFGKAIGKGQLKRNYVTVMILYENGTIDYKKYAIEDQTIIHDLIPRLAGAGYVMYWKKNPMIILPNWSVQPFSPLEHYQKSLIDGSNTTGYKVLMAKMQKEQIKPTGQMSGMLKWIIGIVLAGIVAYAFMTGGGN